MKPNRQKHSHFLTPEVINRRWEEKFYIPAYYSDPEPPHRQSMTALVCDHLRVMCGEAHHVARGSTYQPWYENYKAKQRERYRAAKAAANGIG